MSKFIFYMFVTYLFLVYTGLFSSENNSQPNLETENRCSLRDPDHSTRHDFQLSNCVSFTVGQGTGCNWLCNFCSNQLGTSNYYFTDDVCKYETGGCVGNPIAGKQYTCCSL
jgi:hypothetical protein